MSYHALLLLYFGLSFWIDEEKNSLQRFFWIYKLYTTLTNFSTKFLVMCKVYTDVGGIK